MVFALIRDLSPDEKDQVAAWLACAVHNQREDICRLFSCYRDAELEDGRAFWSLVYPSGRTYRDQDFRLLKSYLLERLEDWLAYREWSKSRLPQVDPFLVDAYQERGLDRHFRNRLGRARRSLQRRPTPDLWTAYRIETQQFDLDAGRRRLETHNLKERDRLLDAAVLRTKLRAACQTLSTHRLRDEAANIPLLSECLELADSPEYRDQLGLQAYRLACRMLLDPAETGEDFSRFHRLLDRDLNQYPDSEQRDLLRLGINYCVGRINQDRHEYIRPAFELYRRAIELELIYAAGEISPFTFNNIMGIALRLGETDWAERFLLEQADHLPTDQQSPLRALNTARLALAREDYNGVLVALRADDYRDFIQQMNARVLQLKAYWALELYYLLETHLRNTRAMLRRKRDTSYHVRNFRNLFELADQLLRLSPGPSTARTRLRQTIEETEPLPEREWLLSYL